MTPTLTEIPAKLNSVIYLMVFGILSYFLQHVKKLVIADGSTQQTENASEQRPQPEKTGLQANGSLHQPGEERASNIKIETAPSYSFEEEKLEKTNNLSVETGNLNLEKLDSREKCYFRETKHAGGPFRLRRKEVYYEFKNGYSNYSESKHGDHVGDVEIRRRSRMSQHETSQKNHQYSNGSLKTANQMVNESHWLKKSEGYQQRNESNGIETDKYLYNNGNVKSSAEIPYYMRGYGSSEKQQISPTGYDKLKQSELDETKKWCESKKLWKENRAYNEEITKYGSSHLSGESERGTKLTNHSWWDNFGAPLSRQKSGGKKEDHLAYYRLGHASPARKDYSYEKAKTGYSEDTTKVQLSQRDSGIGDGSSDGDSSYQERVISGPRFRQREFSYQSHRHDSEVSTVESESRFSSGRLVESSYRSSRDQLRSLGIKDDLKDKHVAFQAPEAENIHFGISEGRYGRQNGDKNTSRYSSGNSSSSYELGLTGQRKEDSPFYTPQKTGTIPTSRYPLKDLSPIQTTPGIGRSKPASPDSGIDSGVESSWSEGWDSLERNSHYRRDLWSSRAIKLSKTIGTQTTEGEKTTQTYGDYKSQQAYQRPQWVYQSPTRQQEGSEKTSVSQVTASPDGGARLKDGHVHVPNGMVSYTQTLNKAWKMSYETPKSTKNDTTDSGFSELKAEKKKSKRRSKREKTSSKHAEKKARPSKTRISTIKFETHGGVSKLADDILKELDLSLKVKGEKVICCELWWSLGGGGRSRKLEHDLRNRLTKRGVGDRWWISKLFGSPLPPASDNEEYWKSKGDRFLGYWRSYTQEYLDLAHQEARSEHDSTWNFEPSSAPWHKVEDQHQIGRGCTVTMNLVTVKF